MRHSLVMTSIYSKFWGTDYFERSLDKLNIKPFNTWQGGNFNGHGTSLFNYYKAMRDHVTKYPYVVYLDGADSFAVKPFEVPNDKIIFSGEKACYPNPEREKDYPIARTKWRFLNGGGWCGPIPLVLEFYERYGLNKYYGLDINGQKEQTTAFLDAVKDGFPIDIDQECNIFQTTAFEDPGDFSILDGDIVNNLTRTKPCVFHGNGRTDMSWIYNHFLYE